MIGAFKSIARSKGYDIYTKPFKLNIWGVRSKAVIPNKFDDALYVFFNANAPRFVKWKFFRFNITTDPGTYWLNNPMKPEGTAILAEGQYKNTYKIDLHRGRYYALCQRLAKVTVIRDYNRNGKLDFKNKNKASGMFGINIHKARKKGTTYQIDNHSAGCQVFQKANDFDFFMRLCEKHRSLYGNRFTYTLIDNRERVKGRLRNGLKTVVLSVAVLLTGRAIYNRLIKTT